MVRSSPGVGNSGGPHEAEGAPLDRNALSWVMGLARQSAPGRSGGRVAHLEVRALRAGAFFAAGLRLGFSL